MTMTPIRILSILLSCLLCLPMAGAQTINWNAAGDTRHILTLGAGWDYSLSCHAGYAYHPRTKVPLIINAGFSMPSGKNFLDDFKTSAGAQAILLNHSSFKLGLSLNGIYRRFETPLVRLQNIGAEMKITFGYYSNRWFAAAEAGFDKAIITHFRHTALFRQNVFDGVQDGWYQPATGGNFLYGLQAGYSFKRSDLTCRIGKITTQDFKTTPRIPYYVILGYNYKIR